MPKESTPKVDGTPVNGDHSLAMEIAAPVIEDESTELPAELGSHQDEDSPEPQTDEPTADVVEELPARLKGKTQAQIIQDFIGLEKEYSRQGNELGEARKLMREMLSAGLQQQKQGASPKTEEPEPTDEDFINDPRAATERLVKKRTETLEKQLTLAEQRALQTEFRSRHPKVDETLADPKFQEWVQSSPYRLRAFNSAANYDIEAGDELFGEWERMQESAAPAPTKAEVKVAAIKQNKTETGGAGAAPKSGSRRIYKSTELMRLYNTDRDRYNSMMPEITKAFQEGRVR